MMSRPITRYLRRMLSPQYSSGLTDTQLLERFVSERDEAAFEILMWRHGPRVLAVCRRILHHEQDAEDAFQATFLVLVRKAGTIRKRQSVGIWLYRVAYRVAMRAKAKRPTGQTRVVDVLADDRVPDRDLWSVLDEEVNRLPEKYRAPFVLCYLDGKSNEEAARQLGCPTGTVKSRLAWARHRLQIRLARRGLALSAAMPGANTVVPAALVDSTLKSVLLGKAAVGPAAVLCTGVLQTMLWTKVKIVTGCVLAVGALGISGGAVTWPMLRASQPARVPQATLPPSQLERGAGARADKPDKVEAPQPKEKTYEFEFHNKPWASVFEWLREQTGKPVIIVRGEVTGTLTYRPQVGGMPKQYTLPEVIDIINYILANQHFILLRHAKWFTVELLDHRLSTEDLPQVPLGELGKWGNTELVAVEIPLTNLDVKDLYPLVSKMIGPVGQVWVQNSWSSQKGVSLFLRDAAGNLRRIYQTIKDIESRDGVDQGQRAPEKFENPERKKTEASFQQPERRIAVQRGSIEEKLDQLLNRLDNIEKRLDSLERSAKTRGP